MQLAVGLGRYFYKYHLYLIKKKKKKENLMETQLLTDCPLNFSTLPLCKKLQLKTNSAWLAALLQFPNPDDLTAATARGDGTSSNSRRACSRNRRPPAGEAGGNSLPDIIAEFCRLVRVQPLLWESHRAETPPANCGGNLEPSAPGIYGGGKGVWPTAAVAEGRWGWKMDETSRQIGNFPLRSTELQSCMHYYAHIIMLWRH